MTDDDDGNTTDYERQLAREHEMMVQRQNDPNGVGSRGGRSRAGTQGMLRYFKSNKSKGNGLNSNTNGATNNKGGRKKNSKNGKLDREFAGNSGSSNHGALKNHNNKRNGNIGINGGGNPALSHFSKTEASVDSSVYKELIAAKELNRENERVIRELEIEIAKYKTDIYSSDIVKKLKQQKKSLEERLILVRSQQAKLVPKHNTEKFQFQTEINKLKRQLNNVLCIKKWVSAMYKSQISQLKEDIDRINRRMNENYSAKGELTQQGALLRYIIEQKFHQFNLINTKTPRGNGNKFVLSDNDYSDNDESKDISDSDTNNVERRRLSNRLSHKYAPRKGDVNSGLQLTNYESNDYQHEQHRRSMQQLREDFQQLIKSIPAMNHIQSNLLDTEFVLEHSHVLIEYLPKNMQRIYEIFEDLLKHMNNLYLQNDSNYNLSQFSHLKVGKGHRNKIRNNSRDSSFGTLVEDENTDNMGDVTDDSRDDGRDSRDPRDPRGPRGPTTPNSQENINNNQNEDDYDIGNAANYLSQTARRLSSVNYDVFGQSVVNNRVTVGGRGGIGIGMGMGMAMGMSIGVKKHGNNNMNLNQSETKLVKTKTKPKTRAFRARTSDKEKDLSISKSNEDLTNFNDESMILSNSNILKQNTTTKSKLSQVSGTRNQSKSTSMSPFSATNGKHHTLSVSFYINNLKSTRINFETFANVKNIIKRDILESAVMKNVSYDANTPITLVLQHNRKSYIFIYYIYFEYNCLITLLLLCFFCCSIIQPKWIKLRLNMKKQA